MAKLKKMLTHPGKNESGQGVLAIVLILLMLGAIILTPLLVFMSTGVKAGQVYESKLQEFYAADAGVEDAIWEINNGTPGEPYFLGEEVNDRNVSVNVTQIKEGTYKIISTATSDTGGNTIIECYYGALDYSSLLDNAITSNGTVCVKGDVNGTTVAENCIQPGCENPNCTPLDELEEPISWPSAEELSEYYYNKVKDYPYSGDTIDLAGNNLTIGPLYQDGDLDIYNSIKNENATLTLNGTVYVTGDLLIATTRNNFILDLNKQTIYCNSSTEKYAITVGPDKPTIIGSGCIIAVGGIYFAPSGDAGSLDDFVLIMSIESTVTLQPSGDFYGAVVGNAEVDLQPGNTLVWTSYEGEGIDFPIGQSMMKVLSYTIK